MATEVNLESLPPQQSLTVSRLEALNIIAFLAAQLADEALPYCPKDRRAYLTVESAPGIISHTITITLDKNK